MGFNTYISEVQDILTRMCNIASQVDRASNAIIKALASGNKVLACGNGGSAGDAQHLVAELVGRFKLERPGLPAIALTTDPSTVTAISNDYGYNSVFSRQVEALLRPGDVLVAISTSGNSQNVISAAEVARMTGGVVIALTGASGGNLASCTDVLVAVPTEVTAHIQEAHIMVVHQICTDVDRAWSEKQLLQEVGSAACFQDAK